MSLSCEVYPDTPEGSEVDELEYANGVAEWLFYMCYTHQISGRRYVERVNWLNTIPGAGEYFKCMCSHDYTPEQLHIWAQYGVQARFRKWVKKGKNGTRRLKTWR